MLLKTRAILVVVVGTVMGLSLSLSGGYLADRQPAGGAELALEQAQMLAEVMQRVKREYVEPVDDNELLDNAIDRGANLRSSVGQPRSWVSSP